MTKMLEQAFTEASKLPPAAQDALAARLLSELGNGGKMSPIASNEAELLGRCRAHSNASA